MGRTRSILCLFLGMLLYCGICANAVEKTADFKCNWRAAEKMGECNAAIEKAIDYLKAGKSQFNIKDPDNELRVRRIDIDQFGEIHIRFRQYYRGLKIIGAGVQVHFDNKKNVKHVLGKYFGTINLETKPAIDSAEAINSARLKIKLDKDSIKESTAELIVKIEDKKPNLTLWTNFLKDMKPL